SFPDMPRTIAKYTDRFNEAGRHYKLLGTYPDGSFIYDDVHKNGPIVAAKLLGDAVKHFFETMSHGNIDVNFAIPRNPGNKDGMWYTHQNASHYPNSRKSLSSVMDSVYQYFPNLINNANYIYSYGPDVSGNRTDIISIRLSDGTKVYHGAWGEGSTTFWPQTMWTITHEIGHRIAYAVGASSDRLTFPDRGVDRSANIYRPGHGSVTTRVMTGTYDLMYHSYKLSTENSLYGQVPFCSFDLIRMGWIAPDEIIEIKADSVSEINDIKLTDMRKQLTSRQKAEGYHRIAKIYLKEDYYRDNDDYFLVEYHKGTDYDRHFSNYDEGIGEGILVWHIVDNVSNRNYNNPAMDILTAVPYNGYYGNPLPDDSYPKTWEIYKYPDHFTGIYKNNEYDWLNDMYIRWLPSGPLTYAPNGGRHLYEVIKAENPNVNWVRRNSKHDDFFTDNEIKGRINNSITPVTRPSSRDWWGNETKISLINMKHENDYMKFDYYVNK
ncbi:MAG: hypothetical protein P8X42_04235, partial [Calditrichaceae bacterium]